MPSLVQSFTLLCFKTGTASTAFVENKLSRGLLSLSPLFTTHPRSLQRTLVRPSISCDRNFSLVMNSSPRFVSLSWESFLWSFSVLRFLFVFTFPLQLFPHIQNSLTHYTKSTRLLFLELPMDISCPVSCKFPHGTLHYQSRQFFSP